MENQELKKNSKEIEYLKSSEETKKHKEEKEGLIQVISIVSGIASLLFCHYLLKADDLKLLFLAYIIPYGIVFLTLSLLWNKPKKKKQS